MIKTGDVDSAKSTIVWRFHDNKPGHINQTRGLLQVLSKLTPIETFDLPVPSRKQSLLWWLTNQFPPGKHLPQPNLILGAGHSTHLAVLAARRRFGGRAVVLMKPSLPHGLFDLCIVPQHDGLTEAENVILTHGVLNLVTPSLKQEVELGLFLIGGPSSSHAWDNGAILEQLSAIISHQSKIAWQLTTSRRTPPDFLDLLITLNLPNLTVVPQERTGPDWVPTELARSAQVWASEDSVSMVYEALTSGARVGLLQVPHKHTGRVTQGMQNLRDLGWITHFADWDRTRPIPPSPTHLNEAQRCAKLLCEKFQLPQAA